MKNQVYKRRMNTRHDLLARILETVARIKKECEDQFRQKKKKTCYLHTQVAKSNGR
jgi:hypothetical protein